MQTTHAVIKFIYEKTNGLVNLSIKDAKALEDIVTGVGINTCHVKLKQYNAVSNTYIFIQTKPTTQAAIDAAIKEALITGPNKEFYLFELYNDANQFEGSIYTLNPHLF